ncbi:MAG: 5'/3'-nucleotidase SurE [Clostridia bacterium]|nr:5'/3'-nucleotidase SurE [Clostridia bacterium]
MRILVTNDDGINAEGIRVLVDFASTIGEVTVCAPKVQQSAKAHAINIYTPFEVKKVEYLGAKEAYAVDSTPADCVRFGTLGLMRDYDVVFSGVNRGLNMGEDISYSGTAGAIFEARYRDIKGVAFSAEINSFDSAREWIGKAYEYIVAHDMLKHADLLNVNIPDNPKGIVVTKQGGAYYTDSFVEIEKDIWKQTGYCIHQNRHDLTIDSDATIDGYVTITPLTHTRTDYKAYEIIRKDV